MVLARAEITRRVSYGYRYLLTRVFLADGRVMQQINPGVAEVEDDWREIGRFEDLDAALADLRRQGWTTPGFTARKGDSAPR